MSPNDADGMANSVDRSDCSSVSQYIPWFDWRFYGYKGDVEHNDRTYCNTVSGQAQTSQVVYECYRNHPKFSDR